MKVNENFVLKTLGEENVLVPVGQEAIDLSKVFTLNESSYFLYSLIVKGKEENELVDELMKEYEVDLKTAKNDVHEFIEVLIKNRIIIK